jgi:hypothetical protein
LLRLRNTHPAFRGEFSAAESTDTELVLRWQRGTELAELRIDFARGRYGLVISEAGALRDIDVLALGATPPARARVAP